MKRLVILGTACILTACGLLTQPPSGTSLGVDKRSELTAPNDLPPPMEVIYPRELDWQDIGLQVKVEDGHEFLLPMTSIVDIDRGFEVAPDLSPTDRAVLEAGVAGLFRMGYYSESKGRIEPGEVQAILSEIKVGKPLPVRYVDSPDSKAYIDPVLIQGAVVGSGTVSGSPSAGFRLSEVWSIDEDATAAKLSEEFPDAALPSFRRTQSLGLAMPENLVRVRLASRHRLAGPLDFFWAKDEPRPDRFLRSDGRAFRSSGYSVSNLATEITPL